VLLNFLKIFLFKPKCKLAFHAEPQMPPFYVTDSEALNRPGDLPATRIAAKRSTAAEPTVDSAGPIEAVPQVNGLN